MTIGMMLSLAQVEDIHRKGFHPDIACIGLENLQGHGALTQFAELLGRLRLG